LLVGVDNVGSKQMQEIRQAMRGFFKFKLRNVIECWDDPFKTLTK